MEGNFQAGSSEKPLSPMDPVQALFAPFLFLILCCQVFGSYFTQQQYQKTNPKSHKLQSLLYKDKITLYNTSCWQWAGGIGFFSTWIEKPVNQT